ncbi:hypothetical protein LARI1_G003872 [Lachnellula arida]|uniref:Uncharacterized protein n=1 Tax=Lachnellula arida TaxID=1316785 RepID=A0A8T9BMP8_9HELO|nr:hypothetical protein LARI1_G003872 [Lachnellula arida]
MAETTAPQAAPPTTSTPSLNLRAPIKLAKPADLEAFKPPPLEWLKGTWSVTHSTLPMWKKAKNVRITYTLIPPSTPGGPTLLDDVVSNKPIKKGLLPSMEEIRGIDYPCDENGDEIKDAANAAQWHWKGKGWLKIAGGSRWEVLGWGEKGEERWVVTWFAASRFTPAGIDVYCGRMEGISKDLYGELEAGLKGLGIKEVGDLAGTMFPVLIE